MTIFHHRMPLKFKIAILFVVAGLAVFGQSKETDTVAFPQLIMELAEVAEHDGDRAGAWGLPTLVALRYGLTVDDEFDERLDEEASKQAAYAYLADLYEEFGDWELCYYAYLYSPAYVKNLLMRGLSIPQPRPVVKKPAPSKTVEKPKAPRHIVYTVKSGDTLSKIARKYNVKVSDIKKWNNLRSDLIRENQKLKIYQ